MKTKGSLVVSTVITAGLITIGIGVIRNVNASNTQVVSFPTATVGQTIDREQAYQQLLTDANAKITLANQQIEQLVNQMPVQATGAVSPYLFSAQQALALATNITGVSPQAIPELVIFNNTPAYEAVYGNGNGKVYIDANNGKLLYNGLQKKPVNITADQAVKIATSYLNRTDVTSIDVTTFNGANVYLVGFSDGAQVFIDITGQIMAIQMPSQSKNLPSSDDSKKHDD